MKTLFLLLLFALVSVPGSFRAKVIGVNSGDSIVVLLDDNTQLRVRLEGIDCPELQQEYGDSAKQATVALCFKKNVRIEKVGEDMYGRTLAFVYVDDLCVNKELLRLGLAWHYADFNNDTTLAQLELEARKNKAGLWKQSNPMAPWEFRRKKK
jgi:micrococcal nuclease